MKIREKLFFVLAIATCAFLVFVGIVPDGYAQAPTKKVSKPGVYSGYSNQIYPEVVRSSRYIQIRGNNLAIDIYRPAKNGMAVSKPHPVIVQNMRYQRRRDIAVDGAVINDWVKRGYVVAILDPRGAGASFGSRMGD
jgi:predicted acyl esterase